MDVQEQSRDGQTVGERDTEGAVTQESEVEVETETDASQETEVEPTLIAEQEQVREQIDKPFQVPNSRIDVTLNQDGTAKVYKRGTNQNLKSVPQKASKYILTDVIDVNEGSKATIPEGATEQDAYNEIATTSNNVSEVAQAIKQVEDSMADAEMESAEGGIFNILQLKFTPQSWKSITGVSPKESGVSNFWISKDGVSIEDGWVDVAPDLDMDMVIDFIQSNPTAADVKNLQKGGLSQDLVALKQRFKELTGLSATKFNIDTVVSIDPNREPLRVTESKNVEQLTRESLDPKVDDFGKKKGPTPEKITGKKRKKIKVDEEAALKDQIRLEARAARDAVKDTKSRISALGKALKLYGQRWYYTS